MGRSAHGSNGVGTGLGMISAVERFDRVQKWPS